MAMWSGLSIGGETSVGQRVSIGGTLPQGQDQLSCTWCLGAVKIANDPSHPLNREFELLPSGRRYKVPGVKS